MPNALIRTEEMRQGLVVAPFFQALPIGEWSLVGSSKACQARSFRVFALFASSKFTCDTKAQHHRWTKQLHRCHAWVGHAPEVLTRFSRKFLQPVVVTEKLTLIGHIPAVIYLVYESFTILDSQNYSQSHGPDDQAPRLADWIAPCLVSRTFPFRAKQTSPWLFFGLATTFRVVLNKPTLW
jgi:hypothetical protein